MGNLVDNLDNILGADTADNLFASTNVTANKDGSIIERLEALQAGGAALSKDASNYGSVSITFAALTTGSVATHEILTVTGMVRLRMIAECTVNVAGSGSIQLGIEGTTNAFIASTAGTDIDAGEVWIDATPTETQGNTSSLMLDKIICGGLDVGYEVTSNTLTGGTIVFHYWWEPLNSTGNVVAADGTGTL